MEEHAGSKGSDWVRRARVRRECRFLKWRWRDTAPTRGERMEVANAKRAGKRSIKAGFRRRRGERNAYGHGEGGEEMDEEKKGVAG